MKLQCSSFDIRSKREVYCSKHFTTLMISFHVIHIIDNCKEYAKIYHLKDQRVEEGAGRCIGPLFVCARLWFHCWSRRRAAILIVALHTNRFIVFF